MIFKQIYRKCWRFVPQLPSGYLAVAVVLMGSMLGEKWYVPVELIKQDNKEEGEGSEEYGLFSMFKSAHVKPYTYKLYEENSAPTDMLRTVQEVEGQSAEGSISKVQGLSSTILPPDAAKTVIGNRRDLILSNELSISVPTADYYDSDSDNKCQTYAIFDDGAKGEISIKTCIEDNEEVDEVTGYCFKVLDNAAISTLEVNYTDFNIDPDDLPPKLADALGNVEKDVKMSNLNQAIRASFVVPNIAKTKTGIMFYIWIRKGNQAIKLDKPYFKLNREAGHDWGLSIYNLSNPHNPEPDQSKNTKNMVVYGNESLRLPLRSNTSFSYWITPPKDIRCPITELNDVYKVGKILSSIACPSNNSEEYYANLPLNRVKESYDYEGGIPYYRHYLLSSNEAIPTIFEKIQSYKNQLSPDPAVFAQIEKLKNLLRIPFDEASWRLSCAYVPMGSFPVKGRTKNLYLLTAYYLNDPSK